jgi:hypothetical protein
VLEFGERIHLVHELRQLGAGEKFFHGSRDWTRIDKLTRDHGLPITGTHPVLDIAHHPVHADAQLVLDQFAHGTHAAIAEVVDIVSLTFRIIIEANHFLDDQDEIIGIQDTILFGIVALYAKTLVQAIAADCAVLLALEF